MLDKIRVVLVSTSHPGNIGAAARALKNMGLSRLVLVNPVQFPHADSVARASGADDILQHALVVDSLQQALTGCSLVLGTSARDRAIEWPLLNPREAAECCVQQPADAEIALVFGREHAGLTNDELHLCHYHVHIPANQQFSSLNLAASVQVLSYELRMAWLQQGQAEAAAPRASEVAASHDELERFYQHLQQTLVDIEFLDPAKPKHLLARLRRMFGRTRLDKVEVNILRGILTETQKAASGELQQRRQKHA